MLCLSVVALLRRIVNQASHVVRGVSPTGHDTYDSIEIHHVSGGYLSVISGWQNRSIAYQLYVYILLDYQCWRHRVDTVHQQRHDHGGI